MDDARGAADGFPSDADGAFIGADGSSADAVSEEIQVGDAGGDVDGGAGGCDSITTGNGANCDLCAAAHCCAEYEVCANDPDCISYADCLNACAVEAGAATPDSGACFDNCGGAHPTGRSELSSYEGCLFGAYCYYACTTP